MYWVWGVSASSPIINISLSQGKGIGSSFSLLTNSNYVFSNSISKQLVLSLWSSTTITTTSSSSCTPKLKSQATKSQAGSSSSWPQQQSQKQEEEEEEEEEFQVVTAIRSQFNDILIVDSPNSRMLLLDATRKLSHNKSLVIKTTSLTPTLLSSLLTPLSFCVIFMLMHADNVHSILYKDQKWTGSYWVCQASLFLYCFLYLFEYDN